MKALCRYDWPGNVRELQNVVERFKVLVDGNTVRMEDLPFSQKEENSEVYPLVTAHDFLLDTVEKRHIQRVLRKMQGNKTRAAQAMGITVKTLYNKLARYGLEETQNDSTVH
jgi:DNA-binding NtrC family response regulator